MSLTTYQINELRPAVGLRWFSCTGSYQLRSLENPEGVWPIWKPLYHPNKIECYTHRNDLSVKDEVNNDKMVVALMGWGEVEVGPSHWKAEYAEPVAIIETQPQLREAVLKSAEKHALPVRHNDQPEDALQDFEGFEKIVKEIYAQ